MCNDENDEQAHVLAIQAGFLVHQSGVSGISAELRSRLRSCANTLSHVRRVLKSDAELRPLRIVGIPCSWLLLKAMVLGAGSLAVVASRFLSSD